MFLAEIFQIPQMFLAEIFQIPQMLCDALAHKKPQIHWCTCGFMLDYTMSLSYLATWLGCKWRTNCCIPGSRAFYCWSDLWGCYLFMLMALLRWSIPIQTTTFLILSSQSQLMKSMRALELSRMSGAQHCQPSNKKEISFDLCVSKQIIQGDNFREISTVLIVF